MLAIAHQSKVILFSVIHLLHLPVLFYLRRPFGHNQVSIYIDGVQNISTPAKFVPLTDVIYLSI